MNKFPFLNETEDDIYVLEHPRSTPTVPSATTGLLQRTFENGDIHYKIAPIEKAVYTETLPFKAGDRVIFSPGVPQAIAEELGVNPQSPLIVWCVEEDDSTLVERDKFTGEAFFPEGIKVYAIHPENQMVIKASLENFSKVEVDQPLSSTGYPLDD